MTDKPPIDPKVSTISDEKVAAVISADIPCLTCEYNLRSLSIQGLCPECGQPVRDTLGHRQWYGQYAILDDLVGFTFIMTVSLIAITLVPVGYFFSLVTLFGLDLKLIALIFVPIYYISVLGSGINIFRITKRPAFAPGVAVTYMGLFAIAFTLLLSNPNLSYFVIACFFSVAIALAIGVPVWFAQHTKHLADLAGNAKLKTHANVTVKICLVLPVLTLIYLGLSATRSITGQPWPSPFQLSSGPIIIILLTILLATSSSSALLGLKLVATAKKLRQTVKVNQSQSSIKTTNPN